MHGLQRSLEVVNVGADRSLKRHALKRLSEIELAAAPNGGDPSQPTVPSSTTLRDALALMLGEGQGQLTVVDEEGRVTGSCSVDLIGALLAETGKERAQ